MNNIYCVDIVDDIYAWCWCDEEGRLVCVDATIEIVNDALRRGIPWCSKEIERECKKRRKR